MTIMTTKWADKPLDAQGAMQVIEFMRSQLTPVLGGRYSFNLEAGAWFERGLGRSSGDYSVRFFATTHRDAEVPAAVKMLSASELKSEEQAAEYIRALQGLFAAVERAQDEGPWVLSLAAEGGSLSGAEAVNRLANAINDALDAAKV